MAFSMASATFRKYTAHLTAKIPNCRVNVSWQSRGTVLLDSMRQCVGGAFLHFEI